MTAALVPILLGTSLSTFSAEQERVTGQANKLNKADEVEVIEVIGNIRSSYEGAIGAKRLADTVVDVITSEDIGQFSDESIAGAIQRIPGVQIERDQAGTDGDRVSIRGLGPEFVNSTINGRTLLSSGNEAKGLRKMNFNVFPSSILSGVRVAKGQTAIAPESGLAGQVDLQTIRPLELKQLDDKNYFGRLSYKAEYRDLADDTGGLLEGSFGWKNDQDNFGFYIGVVSGESDVTFEQFSQTRVTRNLRIDNDGDGIEDELIKGINVPNAQTSRPMKQNIKREALSAGIQWQPSEDLNIVWDITSAKFDNQSQRHNGQTIMNPVWGKTVFDANGIVIDENNVLRYADFSKTTGGGAILSRMQDMQFGNETENFISGLNVNFLGDNLTTNFDVYYSTVDYNQDLRFPIFNKGLNKTLAIYDGTGKIPTLTTGADRLDPTGYAYVQGIVREIELEGKNYGATLKFNYELDMAWLSTVDFGLHYEKTDLDSKRSLADPIKNADDAAAIAAAAVTGELLPDEFLADEDISPHTWLLSDFSAVGAIDPRVYNTGMDTLGIDPAASHESTEQIFALFGQLNLDTEIAELPLSGNIGLRAVYTENEATALTKETGMLNSTSGDYWQYLPSVNLNLALDDNLALRFGFSKTLSRPEYSDMAPIISIKSQPICLPEELPEDCVGKATAGNPDLDPMTSLNYDLTLEWYNDFDGSAVVSVFYKDVSDFIIDDLALSQTLPGQPADVLYDLDTPINFSDGEAKGYEIGFYQPFDKLVPALTGFGFAVNYTYVNSSFDEDNVGDSGFGFPGSSENNYNFVGFYENTLFSVRLAYVYRGEFFRSLEGQGSQTTDARFTGESEQLDVNVKLRPMQGLTLAFNANNLLGDNRRDHVGNEAKFLDYFETGRTYSITASYSF